MKNQASINTSIKISFALLYSQSCSISFGHMTRELMMCGIVDGTLF